MEKIDIERAKKHIVNVVFGGGFVVAGSEEAFSINGMRRWKPKYELEPPKEIRDLPQFNSKHIYFKDKADCND